MKRTLIALLATAAISLPAAAQTTRRGAEQDQGSRQNAGKMERGTKGYRAGGTKAKQYRKGKKAGQRLRGRTAYYESRRGSRVRGRGGYEEYDRGPTYVYGRRGYTRHCPRYIYIDGRRVLNERCVGRRSGRKIYNKGHKRGPRYTYYRERDYSTRYGGRKTDAYASRHRAVREHGRSPKAQRARVNERGGETYRERSSFTNEYGGQKAGAHASRHQAVRNRGAERASTNERRATTRARSERGGRQAGAPARRRVVVLLRGRNRGADRASANERRGANRGNQASRSARNRPEASQSGTR
jgi:hypothetical protein